MHMITEETKHLLADVDFDEMEARGLSWLETDHARVGDFVGLATTYGWTDEVKGAYEQLTPNERAEAKDALEMPLFGQARSWSV